MDIRKETKWTAEIHHKIFKGCHGSYRWKPVVYCFVLVFVAGFHREVKLLYYYHLFILTYEHL